MVKETDSQEQAEILEQGNIYFMYRPQVREEEPRQQDSEGKEAEGVEDVERFYMALKPKGKQRYRLIVIGRKRVPKVKEHERTWGFVDMVSDNPKELEQALREHTYSTKTRGERVQPAARPAGEGVYAIVAVGNQAHLVYALELPRQTDEVQRELRIRSEASFALSIKNPEKGSPRSAGLKQEQKADYPKKQQEKFRDRRFDREHPELLDYEGAEIILIGARSDPERKYGLDLEPEKEDLSTADILKDLKMARSRHPVEPLVKGGWR